MKARYDLVAALFLSVGVHGMALHSAGAFGATSAHAGLEAEASRNAPFELKVLTPEQIPQTSGRAQSRFAAKPQALPLPLRRQPIDSSSEILEAWQSPKVPGAPVDVFEARKPLPETASRRPVRELPDGSVAIREPRGSAAETSEQVPVSNGEGETGEPVLLHESAALVEFSPELRYPTRALRRGLEGTVTIGIEVTSSGVVLRTWVMRSSGHRELDRAARENLALWRFRALATGSTTFQKDVVFGIL